MVITFELDAFGFGCQQRIFYSHSIQCIFLFHFLQKTKRHANTRKYTHRKRRKRNKEKQNCILIKCWKWIPYRRQFYRRLSQLAEHAVQFLHLSLVCLMNSCVLFVSLPMTVMDILEINFFHFKNDIFIKIYNLIELDY